MRKTALIAMALISFAVAEAQAKSPPRDVLGLRLGMEESEVHRRLRRIGRETGYEPAKREKRKELWEVRHARISSVAMKFDDDGRLSWITAFSRPEGKRLRYQDIADVRAAERTGYYIYVWKVPARGESPAYAVTARGADPHFLGNYSLYYLPGGSEGEREESD